MSAEIRDGMLFITAKNVVLRISTDLSQAAGKPILTVSREDTPNFQINHDGDILQTEGSLVSSSTTSILDGE